MYKYSFTNTTGKKIQLDVYATLEDYSNAHNVFLQYAIAPGGKTELPLTPLKEYYLDWYSDDHTLNNWFNYEAPGVGGNVPIPIIRYTPPKTDAQIAITAGGLPDTARSIILNGNQHSSQWIAVLQYQGGTTISPPYVEALFRKNFTASIKTLDNNGDTAETSYVYTVTPSLSSGQITMWASLKENLQSKSIYSFLYDPTIPGLYMSRDTLYCQVIDGSGSRGYCFVRE